MIILAPVRNGIDKGLFDLWPKNLDNTNKRLRSAEGVVTCYCFCMLVYFAAMFAWAVWSDTLINASDPMSALLILPILAFPVVGLYFFIRIKMGKNNFPLKEISVAFWLTAIGGAVAQTMLILFIFTFSSHGASGSEDELKMFCLYVFFGIIALGAIQFFSGSVIATMARSQLPIEKFIFPAVVLIILPLIIPPAGAKIALTALQMMSAGGRSCVILTLAEKNITPGYQDIFIDSHQSGKLRILFEADGIYRMQKYHPPFQKTTSEKIYFIPLSTIASMDSCAGD